MDSLVNGNVWRVLFGYWEVRVLVEYRKATVEDIDLVAKIRLEFLSEVNNINNDDEKFQLHESIRHYMSCAIADESFVSWLAIENEEVVAISGVSFYTLPPNKKCLNGKVAYISNMYTYPSHRNRGIASKLFDLTVKEAKKRDCTKISLNATDMGRSLYEKYGFTDTVNDMVYYTC